MTHFEHNLPILRRRAGYTQENLAEALGVSRQAVSKWESGQSLPEAATLLTLADLLSCTLDQLMREELSAEDFPRPLPPRRRRRRPVSPSSWPTTGIWTGSPPSCPPGCFCPWPA